MPNLFEILNKQDIIELLYDFIEKLSEKTYVNNITANVAPSTKKIKAEVKFIIFIQCFSFKHNKIIGIDISIIQIQKLITPLTIVWDQSMELPSN